ncbi:MAG: Lin0368 family putative glycerol transporter subunit [Peptostreptococcaceae bacterium]
MAILRTAIGGTIAGLFAGGVWGQFAAERYGIIGGWFAAFVIISLMWFMNHYTGLIHNDPKAAFVDMATAIGTTCIVRDICINGADKLPASLPTFVCLAIGGCLGGYLAHVAQKSMQAEKEEASENV